MHVYLHSLRFLEIVWISGIKHLQFCLEILVSVHWCLDKNSANGLPSPFFFVSYSNTVLSEYPTTIVKWSLYPIKINHFGFFHWITIQWLIDCILFLNRRKLRCHPLWAIHKQALIECFRLIFDSTRTEMNNDHEVCWKLSDRKSFLFICSPLLWQKLFNRKDWSVSCYSIFRIHNHTCTHADVHFEIWFALVLDCRASLFCCCAPGVPGCKSVKLQKCLTQNYTN